jgi:hypothetical protein
MENKKRGKIPIINISSSNLSNGLYGEYLTFLDYSLPRTDFKYSFDNFDDSNAPDNITQSFKSNKMIGDTENINTNMYSIPKEDFIENEIKYITSIPITKELVLPIPEQFGIANPTQLNIYKNFDDWFLNNVFYQNKSIRMKKTDDKASENDSPEGIKNKTNFKILFNANIIFSNILNDEEVLNEFNLSFGFTFSTTFITSFVTCFEYLKTDLISFLINNNKLILDLENKNNLNLSEILNDNTTINSLDLIEFKIINNKENYLNLKNYKNSTKIYNCSFKLIPQDYINIIDYDTGTYDIQNNLNTFYQSFSNENTIIFDKLFNSSILDKYVNKSEDINIININTGLDFQSNSDDPDLINLKTFLRINLISFIENLELFPYSSIESSRNINVKRAMNTVPSEISYNTIKNSSLMEIGKRQIILKFNNNIILNDSGIYSDIYIIQYNINEARLELIPVISSDNYSLFTSDEIINCSMYNRNNIDKSFKFYNKIDSGFILDSEYSKYIIYNNTEGLGTRLKQDQTKETITETNKYRLKIIKNYNLTQTQINNLVELNEGTSSSSLVYSSYGLSTIYIS